MCTTKQSDVGTLQDQLEREVAQLGTERDSWRGEQQLLKQERQQLTDQLIDAKQQLAAATSRAGQQQQRDQTYQDELVTDKQEALQVWQQQQSVTCAGVVSRRAASTAQNVAGHGHSACAYAHLRADNPTSGMSQEHSWRSMNSFSTTGLSTSGLQA